jgi:hypothetical protein
MIERLNLAIQGCYKNKNFSEKEKDLGILVLRIGGPKLLTAFNKVNMLPSHSVVSSMVSGKYSIAYGYEKSIEELIDENMGSILKEKHFLSIKMDELVIVPRIKWCCHTNEIVGTCFNHRDGLEDYKLESYLNLDDMKEALDKGCLAFILINNNIKNYMIYF